MSTYESPCNTHITGDIIKESNSCFRFKLIRLSVISVQFTPYALGAQPSFSCLFLPFLVSFTRASAPIQSNVSLPFHSRDLSSSNLREIISFLSIAILSFVYIRLCYVSEIEHLSLFF